MSVDSIEAVQPVCCEYCGLPIDEPGGDCPALDSGVCRP